MWNEDKWNNKDRLKVAERYFRMWFSPRKISQYLEVLNTGHRIKSLQSAEGRFLKNNFRPIDWPTRKLTNYQRKPKAHRHQPPYRNCEAFAEDVKNHLMSKFGSRNSWYFNFYIQHVFSADELDQLERLIFSHHFYTHPTTGEFFAIKTKSRRYRAYAKLRKTFELICDLPDVA
jgi:hypothetical protein